MFYRDIILQHFLEFKLEQNHRSRKEGRNRRTTHPPNLQGHPIPRIRRKLSAKQFQALSIKKCPKINRFTKKLAGRSHLQSACMIHY